MSPSRPSITEPKTGSGPDADRRWRLEDQREFLVRSLQDLRTEREAGDIGVEDFEALVARDEGRLAAVDAELGELEEAERLAAPANEAKPGSARARRRRAWLAIVAVVALTAGTTLLVIRLASPRLPGQPDTGSTPQTIPTQLAEAATLVDEGTKASLTEALALYRQVLKEDPNQPQALDETGYLEWEAGFSAHDGSLEARGRTLVERSLKVEPDDYAAHLFLGTIDLEQDHDPAAAVAQYRRFLAERPPKARVDAAAALVRRAFTEADQPVPAAVSTG
ncbi:MAG: tetratricopeptide repeat protein [Acidimicrobiales bacterium]